MTLCDETSPLHRSRVRRLGHCEAEHDGDVEAMEINAAAHLMVLAIKHRAEREAAEQPLTFRQRLKKALLRAHGTP